MIDPVRIDLMKLDAKTKRAFMESLSPTDFESLYSYKVSAAITNSSMAQAMTPGIVKLKENLASLISNREKSLQGVTDRGIIEAVNAHYNPLITITDNEISKKEREQAKFKNLGIIYNVEACMCFIESSRRQGRTEKDYNENEKKSFPIRSWEMIEAFCRQFGYYDESESESQSSK